MAQPIIFKIPDHKVIFIATPKSGNSSILYSLSHLIPGIMDRAAEPVQKLFLDYSITRAEAYALKKDHLIFSIVRNPWDRVISHYSDKVSGGKDLHDRLKKIDGFYYKMPFEEYLTVLSLNFKSIKDAHIQPQSDNFFYKKAFLPDFMMRYERLNDDFFRLRQILLANGINLGELTHKNKSNRANLNDVYSSKALIRSVYSMYRRDCDLFGYKYEA